jgi:hypothetical protein
MSTIKAMKVAKFQPNMVKMRLRRQFLGRDGKSPIPARLDRGPKLAITSRAMSRVSGQKTHRAGFRVGDIDEHKG